VVKDALYTREHGPCTQAVFTGAQYTLPCSRAAFTAGDYSTEPNTASLPPAESISPAIGKKAIRLQTADTCSRQVWFEHAYSRPHDGVLLGDFTRKWAALSTTFPEVTSF